MQHQYLLTLLGSRVAHSCFLYHHQFFLRGEGPGWPGGLLGNLENWKVFLGRESGETGRLRKPDRREEQMDSRDGQMDGTEGWTDWMGRCDEPDGWKPDGC